MDSRSRKFLNDLESQIDFAAKGATSLFQLISEMQGMLNDHRFECDEDFLQATKPITLFSGAYPQNVEDLIDAIEDMPDFIAVKDMVESGIYHSKTTLNKKLCQGLIPRDVYVESGSRRFFIKEKLLEYINENFR